MVDITNILWYNGLEINKGGNLMKIFKLLIVLICVLLVTSCGYANWVRESGSNYGNKKQAEGIVQTTNPNVKLELLFSTDEFSVYRFIDMKHSRYIAVKHNSIEVSSVMTYSSGKKLKSTDNSIVTLD